VPDISAHYVATKYSSLALLVVVLVPIRRNWHYVMPVPVPFHEKLALLVLVSVPMPRRWLVLVPVLVPNPIICLVLVLVPVPILVGV
jgi:hypothetical protein